MVKDFISDQDGLYRNPFDGAVIKGDMTDTSLIAKYVKDPFIVLNPYGGAQEVPGGTPYINQPGNTAVEIPINMNYQDGGAISQQQQIIQQIVQMFQQGADPQQVMQQLVKMGIPSKDAEKLVGAVINRMQTAMAEQQEAQMGEQDQEGVADQEQDMSMAKDGGCIDCQEQFPQAQNLNWFYKAKGGEAFPQANPYPHMYAGGGEAFPQAQTYMPYDRGDDEPPNFMFEYGGTTDIDQAYQMMKRGGLDMNPKKKRGGKFTPESFDDYVKKNGGDLPMHQGWLSQVRPSSMMTGLTSNLASFLQGIGLGTDETQSNSAPASAQPSFAQEYPAGMQNIMNALNRQQAASGRRAAATPARPAAAQATPVRATSAAATPAGPGLESIKPIFAPGYYDPNAETVDFTGISAQPLQQAQTQQVVGTPGTQGTTAATTPTTASGWGAQPSLFGPRAASNLTVTTPGVTNPMGAYSLGYSLGNYNPKLAALSNLASAFGAGIGSLGFGKSKIKFGNKGYTDPNTGRPITKIKGNAADIAAAQIFANMGATQPQTTSAQPVNVPGLGYGYNLPYAGQFPDLIPYKRERNEQVGGSIPFEYSFYDGQPGAAPFYSAGVNAGTDLYYQRQRQEQAKNRSTISKYPMGSPMDKGEIYGSINTRTPMGTVESNFTPGAYLNAPLQNLNMSRFGGNILDQFEDGAEVDLKGMSQKQIRDFVNAIYAAGGSVDYI